MTLTIYTDGASRGNPGHSSYGFVVTDENGKVLHKEGKYLGVNTNNFAEYSGVLAAVAYVKKNFKEGTDIKFFMDSKLVVEQLSGRYKIKSPTLIQLIREIWKTMQGLGEVTYTHVPRAKNAVADSLANLALDSH